MERRKLPASSDARFMGKTGERAKPKKIRITQLKAAIRANDVRTLISMRESGESLAGSDSFGNNILHWAVEYGKAEIFDYVMKLDEVNKNKVNKIGYCPLTWALDFLQPKFYCVVKLIESDCDLSVFLPDGQSPVHRAVEFNLPILIESLIEKGADFDVQHQYNKGTPLHMAATFGHIDIIWMLLFYGADPNITCIDDERPSCKPYESHNHLTFFDLIYEDELLFDRFSKYDKNFNLIQFAGAIDRGTDSFNQLMNVTSSINYSYGGLMTFSKKFLGLDPNTFKIFITKFGYIVKAIWEHRLFKCLFMDHKPIMSQTICENLFTLLESDILSTVVLKDSQLLFSLVESFSHEENIEPLTQVLCAFLSYGMDITNGTMNKLYSHFGHSDLFKIMLHMNITGIKEKKRKIMSRRDVWPTIMYDVHIDYKDVINFVDHDKRGTYKLYNLSSYFTIPKVDERVPSLVELARNASRKHTIEKYETRNSMQFYTVLKKLPIAEGIKKIISFEEEL